MTIRWEGIFGNMNNKILITRLITTYFQIKIRYFYLSI
jgi:hypothetical protein